jgi:peroxiredoxin
VKTYGISRDSAWSHVAWAQVLDLGDIPLLSDWNGDAVDAYGIGHEYRGMQGVADRSAFLVGGDGIIRGAWRYDAGELPDFDELVSAARSLS